MTSAMPEPEPGYPALSVRIRTARASDALWMATLHDANTRARVQDPSQGFVQGRGHTEERVMQWIADRHAWVAMSAEHDEGPGLGFAVCHGVHGLDRQGPAIVQYVVDNQKALLLHGAPLSRRRWRLYGPVCVNEAARGRGIASDLFRHVASDVSRQSQVQALVLCVDVVNQAAVHLHRDHLRLQRMARVQIDGHDYLVMGQSIQV